MNKKISAITYEESRVIAHDGADDERASLAARQDVKPEVLYYLAVNRHAKVTHFGG